MSPSEHFNELDPQIAEAFESLASDLRSEIEQRLADTREKLVGLARESRETHEAAARAAAAAPLATLSAAPPDAVEELKHAAAQIDRATSQADVLNGLLEGSGRFSSRAALLLVRGEELECWGASGFADPGGELLGLAIEPAPDSPWAKLIAGRGGVPLEPDDCAPLCDPVGAARPTVGLLVPLVLGGKVSAALYADRLNGGTSLDVSALQLLTYLAGQVVETLPLRDREETVSLRLADEGVEVVEAAPAVEAAAVVEAAEEEAPEAVAVEEAPAEAPPEAPAFEVAEEPALEEPPAPEIEAPELGEPELGKPELEELAGVELETGAESFPGPDASKLEEATAAFPIADSSGFSPGFQVSEEEPAVEAAPPTPPAPAPVEPEPAPIQPEPEPVGPEATAEPPASADVGGSTQVLPPPDVKGPGWAFTTTQFSADAGQEARHEEARRLARLLVTEIKLYNEDEVEAGRRNRDVYQRLKEDIDRSRQIYEERVEEGIRGESDYFHDALVRILGGGDEKSLGA